MSEIEPLSDNGIVGTPPPLQVVLDSPAAASRPAPALLGAGPTLRDTPPVGQPSATGNLGPAGMPNPGRRKRVMSADQARALRRLWAHLTRSRARGAMILAVLTALIYAVVPMLGLAARVADPIRQFALIMVGVAATAVFLPELSSDLWTLSRQKVRDLVPEDRRQALARELISAESDDHEWNAIVFEQALSPLLAASRDQSQIVRNMNYVIQVHVRTTKVVHGTSMTFHNVETTSNSLRVLPKLDNDGMFHIAVARTEQALQLEFGQLSCLSREIVPLTDDAGRDITGKEWREKIKSMCRISVTINGQVQEARTDDDDPTPDLVRWQIRPEYPEVGQRVPMQINLDYPMSVSEDRFPAYFQSYYCAGATTVSLKAYGLSETAELRCESFFGRGLGTSAARGQVVKTESTIAQQLSFSTGRDSLLWPGSGVVFSWHECKPDTVANS